MFQKKRCSKILGGFTLLVACITSWSESLAGNIIHKSTHLVVSFLTCSKKKKKVVSFLIYFYLVNVCLVAD